MAAMGAYPPPTEFEDWRNGFLKCPAYIAVQRYLDTDRSLFYWNDHFARTPEQVVATLRAAAVIEYAREQQESAWLTYAGCVTA